MLASFIIPIYKIEEEFLRECLDSLHKIKTKDVEFILVEDGSPDNSGQVCEEYKKSDERFVVIHKVNEGVSVARNTGIKIARGDYITFVDADDWVESFAVDIVLNNIANSKLDIYVCNQYINFKGKEPLMIKAFENDITFGNSEVEKLLTMVFVRGYNSLKSDPGAATFCNAVGKFVKKRILVENRIELNPNIKMGEDALLFLRVFIFCKSCSYINSYVYHYRMRATSVNHSIKNLGYSNIEVFYNEAIKIAKTTHQMEELRNALLGRCFDLIFEQFVPTYVLTIVPYLKKRQSFKKEMNRVFVRELRENLNLDNYPKIKDKIKLILIKCKMCGLLFDIQYFWISINGSLKTNEYY